MTRFLMSKATKLNEVVFRFAWPRIQWISKTLQTARLDTLRRICTTSYTIFNPTEDVVREWQELDHLLLRLWTSHSIIPKVPYEEG